MKNDRLQRIQNLLSEIDDILVEEALENEDFNPLAAIKEDDLMSWKDKAGYNDALKDTGD